MERGFWVRKDKWARSGEDMKNDASNDMSHRIKAW